MKMHFAPQSHVLEVCVSSEDHMYERAREERRVTGGIRGVPSGLFLVAQWGQKLTPRMQIATKLVAQAFLLSEKLTPRISFATKVVALEIGGSNS